MPESRQKGESRRIVPPLHRGPGLPIAKCMARKSPLEDPETAAFAWARYRRIMRFMLLVTVGVVALALAVLYDGDGEASVHYYIAIALGIGFTMLLASALMGLVFLSAGTGHDDSIED